MLLIFTAGQIQDLHHGGAQTPLHLCNVGDVGILKTQVGGSMWYVAHAGAISSM